MPDPVDPSSLDGEALTQWYTRSPDKIEQARQKAYSQRFNDFFNQPQPADPDPGFSRELPTSSVDVDPGFSRGMDGPTKDIDPGFSWVQVGANRWRSVPNSADNIGQPATSPDTENGSAVLDKGLAGADDGGELIDVGNPANPRLRREHIREHGYWPTIPETGRNYDVAHIVAKADGGTDTLDNIRPMHPDDHRAEHMANGDFGRWGARSARTTASPVAPNAPMGRPPLVGAANEVSSAPRIPLGGASRLPMGRMPKLPGLLGIFGIASDALGIASGRIRARTDTWDNYRSDLLGEPSLEDRQKANEDYQRLLNPRWKRGDPYVL